MTSFIFSNEYIIFFWNRWAKCWVFFFIIILSPPPRYNPPPPLWENTPNSFLMLWLQEFLLNWIRIPRYWISHLVRKMEVLLEEISRETITQWNPISLSLFHLQSQVHLFWAFMMSFSKMESRCVEDKDMISATCIVRKWNHGG